VSDKREMRSMLPANYAKLLSEPQRNDIVAYIRKNRSDVNAR